MDVGARARVPGLRAAKLNNLLLSNVRTRWPTSRAHSPVRAAAVKFEGPGRGWFGSRADKGHCAFGPLAAQEMGGAGDAFANATAMPRGASSVSDSEE